LAWVARHGIGGFAKRHSGSVDPRSLWPYEERRGYPFRENEVGLEVSPKLTGEDLKEIGNFSRLVFERRLERRPGPAAARRTPRQPACGQD
jgi:hypothetical protein